MLPATSRRCLSVCKLSCVFFIVIVYLVGWLGWNGMFSCIYQVFLVYYFFFWFFGRTEAGQLELVICGGPPWKASVDKF